MENLPPPATPPSGEIRSFLIADVRGYTRFTQERGDDAAATLAKRFADVAREIVQARRGSVIELRGDEALCAFTSARQAILAAIDLQERFVDETASDPAYPLPVGIGLDAGEAVPVEEGYRGGALNLAARLCAQAGPGEVFASQSVVHLAGRIEGVRFIDRGTVRLKNIADPVRLMRVLPDGRDPAERLRDHWQPPAVPTRRSRRNPIVAAALVVAVAATALVFFLGRGSRGGVVEAGSVGFLTTSSSRLKGQTHIGDAPAAIAAGAGAVWVTDVESGTVARIDPTSGSVQQRIPVGQGPSGVTVSAGHVWVANSDERTVSDINPGSGPGQERVVATIPVGNGPLGMETTGTRIWVANSVDATVTEIDAVSGNVVGTHPVGSLPTGIAQGEGSVWLSQRGDGSVAQISAQTGKVIRSIAVGRGPTGIAFGLGAVWVANTDDGTVSRLDPRTASVTATTRVGRDPVSVVVAGERIWVANAGDGTIAELDPSGRIARTVSVTNSPRALARVGDAIWVAVQASLASHRGGTLTVASEPDLSTLDPGDLFDLFDLNLRAPIMAATNDGLVTLRKVGGIGGSTVVPDLATTLPVPTDDGTTYTFVLRDGVRFSTGATLMARDVKASFERLLSKQGASRNQFIAHALVIEGAGSCRPGRCDLTAGIGVDETSRTVTFHLTRADPDFLRHLTLPVFAILPAGTPLDLGVDPPAATGPYRIASFNPGRTLELERNPVFRVWSADAQPDGFPDRITFRFGVKSDEQVDGIQKGTLDVMYFDIPSAERLAQLGTRAPRQIHPTSSLTTLGFFLNAKVRPFNDVRARQAFAYALDRGEIARLFAASRPGLTPAIGCNMIAPGLPGYVPYCPHTRDPNPLGTWSAPDLAAAKQLVQASGTRGTAVTVWSLADLSTTARAVAQTLEAIGYKTSVKLPARDEYERLVKDPSTGAQIGIVGVDAYSGAPSELIREAFHCAGKSNRPSTNIAQFCNRDIDRRIDLALSLQQTDQYAAARAWAAIDHDLVDLAPFVNFAIPGGPRVVSARVGNYQTNPVIGTLLAQLWVR